MGAEHVRPARRDAGSALRRARELRGISLEVAARDTRLPVDRLRAIEQGTFEARADDVHARASLRTYARYLGLDPTQVLAAAGRFHEPPPPPPPARLGSLERALAAARIRDNQRFFLIAAAVFLGTLAAVGLLSRQGAAPAAELPSATTGALAEVGEATPFTLVVEAVRPARIAVRVDGSAQRVAVAAGETVSFSGTERIEVRIDDGGAVRVAVDGHDLGVPTLDGVPWSATFTSASVRALGPEPTAAPSRAG
ncbi:MAG: hypothetical protein KatS3mg013_0266 [Actinomycetota bacterium]|jgi:cytoskeleton protein RodZ|nr:MAG: hypothetical protein KatS3mg013_0266 [Actinomycetota bacterium]